MLDKGKDIYRAMATVSTLEEEISLSSPSLILINRTDKDLSRMRVGLIGLASD